MDLFCTNCGEPWDVDHVVHDEPDDFERHGSAITRCPACPKDDRKILKASKDRAEAAAMITDLLGDDIDGAAAEMEDLGL